MPLLVPSGEHLNGKSFSIVSSVVFGGRQHSCASPHVIPVLRFSGHAVLQTTLRPFAFICWHMSSSSNPSKYQAFGSSHDLDADSDT